MRRFPATSKFSASAALCWLITACASAPPPPPAPPPAPPPPQCNEFETIDIELIPEPRLNPDREGYPRSVVVRIYQLEGIEAFERASYEELWHDASGGVAARSVVGGPDELTLIPGQLDKRALKRNAKATHVAVAAKFREHQGMSGWKAVTSLAPPNPCPSQLDPTAARVGFELSHFNLRVR